MRKLLSLITGFVLITFLSSWGYFAHYRINRLAVYTLPKPMAAFYKANIGFIVEHAITPDKRRYVDSTEIPRHFFNADRYGKNPFNKIPRKWKDFEKRYGRDTMLKHGILPWTIQQNYYWLVKAFKEHDTLSILRTSANLAHYVADAHVPLHLALNHDGQLTGQEGIHALWESRLPELFGGSYTLLPAKARYINNPLTEAFRICRSSFGSADSVLRLQHILNKTFPETKKYSVEKRGNRKVKVYSVEYCRAYHNMLKGMIQRRMRSAMIAAGSYWFSAWVDAGQPDLNRLISKTIIKRDTR
ncbi:zinc dependent phospholipase C family protein [Mucilaginibacter limnophilus]|uniref:zinc dependent phospholipase C family protein n=1 Tax=Mucilaginibacter limnophilus TaxID=1932778 RepID=UPI001F0C1693|nr:zinc dependent phospholipase C family protein [Mucilaginibacter limnophilus]